MAIGSSIRNRSSKVYSLRSKFKVAGSDTINLLCPETRPCCSPVTFQEKINFHHTGKPIVTVFSCTLWILWAVDLKLKWLQWSGFFSIGLCWTWLSVKLLKFPMWKITQTRGGFHEHFLNSHFTLTSLTCTSVFTNTNLIVLSKEPYLNVYVNFSTDFHIS